jgi:hypothetical protein
MGQTRGANRPNGRRPRPQPPGSAGGCEDVWRFLRDYMVDNDGQSPSAREIAQGTGRPLGGVQHALRTLEQRRLIICGRFGRARSIRIVGARYLLPDGPAGGEGYERQSL